MSLCPRAVALVVGVAIVARSTTAIAQAPNDQPPSPQPPPASPPPALPQPQPAPPQPPPDQQPAAELEKLRSQLATLQTQLETLRSQLDKAEASRTSSAKDVDERLDTVTEQAGGQQRAVKLLLAGTATANYAKANDGDNTYSVSLSPHLLWSFYERIMFESHVDVRASDSGNSLNLEFAAAWVVVSDHVVVGAGKLLAPFGFYTEAIHTAWLNRLPDEPLPVADHTGLTPTHLIGVEARGVLELDPGVITAAVYGGSSGVLDMTTEGTLRGGLVDFDHFEHVAGGGRVTYRPYPSLEIGVSSQLGRVDPSDPPGDIAAPGRVMSWIGGADASVSRVVDFLSGTIDAKAELVVSELRQRDGTAFDRTRRGLYLQTSYSPTQVDAKWLRGFEAVVRYDRLGPSEMIPSVDRFATGLDYWFTASIVAKLAGELSVTDSAPPHRYTVLGQVAVGF